MKHQKTVLSSPESTIVLSDTAKRLKPFADLFQAEYFISELLDVVVSSSFSLHLSAMNMLRLLNMGGLYQSRSGKVNLGKEKPRFSRGFSTNKAVT
jgi:hypothetical protein